VSCLANCFERVFYAELGDELTTCETGHELYKFYRNFPEVHSTVVHFQLRNLIWSTSSHDLFVVHSNRIVHWNMLTGDNDVVLDLTGTKSDSLSRSMGVVHVSTSCVKGSLAAAGAQFNCPSSLLSTIERSSVHTSHACCCPGSAVLEYAMKCCLLWPHSGLSRCWESHC
jgi:hypothetical protein